MATITSKRQFQAIPMIGLILGLFYSFGLSIAACTAFLSERGVRMFSEWEFWAVNGAMLTAFAGYFLLVCEAAAARLSFASDNRSSRLRAIMALHQMLFTGWMVVLWTLEKGHPDFYLVFMIPAGIQWYLLGTLMIGESPHLSSRVKRATAAELSGANLPHLVLPRAGQGIPVDARRPVLHAGHRGDRHDRGRPV